jgi:hypothetical protein
LALYLSIGDIDYSLSRQQVTRDVLEYGNKILGRILHACHRLASVSLVIDACTIYNYRFLDLILASADSGVAPFLDDAVERKRVGFAEYAYVVGDAITALSKAGVKIKLIVGDNQPVQVMAFAHWVPNSPLKTRGPNSTGFDFKRASAMYFNW